MLSDRPQWDGEGSDWPNRAHSRFVDTGRMRWHVQIMGPDGDDVPVLLLLHGTGAATHSWRDLMPMLAGHHRVIAMDLPGHGFTSGRPIGGLSMPAMAQAVGALMTALGVSPTVLIGHSAGAAIAAKMVLAGHAAPRLVIGLNPALMPFPGIAAKIFPTMARMLFVNPFAPHIFATIARQRGEVGRFLARSTGSPIDARGAALYGRLFGSPGHCAGAISMMAEWDLDALSRDLPGLSVPLLLVHGAKDAAIPLSAARDATALVAGARLEILPDLGHLAHEEDPAAIAALITAAITAPGAAS